MSHEIKGIRELIERNSYAKWKIKSIREYIKKKW